METKPVDDQIRQYYETQRPSAGTVARVKQIIRTGVGDDSRPPHGVRSRAVAWIQTIEREEASADLLAAYERIAGARGVVANIFRIHSVRPRAMLAHLELYRELMFAPSDLSRAEREMIAVAVSVTNACHY